MAERATAGNGNAMLLAPRQHCVLDAPLLQVIEHLVAGEPALACTADRRSLFEVGDVEIADAPGEYLTGPLKVIKPGDRLFERVGATPVPQVAVEPVGIETGQGRLARQPRP